MYKKLLPLVLLSCIGSFAHAEGERPVTPEPMMAEGADVDAFLKKHAEIKAHNDVIMEYQACVTAEQEKAAAEGELSEEQIAAFNARHDEPLIEFESVAATHNEQVKIMLTSDAYKEYQAEQAAKAQ